MQKEKRQVTILTTGGTIEKTYSEFDGSIRNRESLIKKKLLSKLRLPHTEIQVEEVMSKDSLEMNEIDREIIFQKVQNHYPRKNPIVILHGTDTLDKTLRHCYSRDSEPPFAVVFTGAMRPAGFDDTDATQNFTEALLAVQFLPPGWYVVFHSRVFKAPKVRKDRRRLTFEESPT